MTALLQSNQLLQLREQYNEIFIEERIESFAVKLLKDSTDTNGISAI